jgi:hypothetical protein
LCRFETLGLRVIEEVPTPLAPRGLERVVLQTLTLESGDGTPIDVDARGPELLATLDAIWDGRAEADDFNRLVLSACSNGAARSASPSARRRRKPPSSRTAMPRAFWSICSTADSTPCSSATRRPSPGSLSACTAAQQQAFRDGYTKSWRESCQRHGFTPGSQAFVDCVDDKETTHMAKVIGNPLGYSSPPRVDVNFHNHDDDE